MRELLPENDGSQVRVISLTNSVDQNGFSGIEASILTSETVSVKPALL